MDRRVRLDAAIKRKDRIAADVQRVKGRLDSARLELQKLETECRSKNIDPNRLDETISQLEAKYDQAISELEEVLQKAEADLNPYLVG